ncbi:NADH-quinone oxidoreductase subunit D, partial [Frankia casuarinae]
MTTNTSTSSTTDDLTTGAPNGTGAPDGANGVGGPTGTVGGPGEHPAYEAGFTESANGRVYTVTGSDWEQILGVGEEENERIVVNMGPQHPSTHGVLRLVLEIEGETVTETRLVIGYLHTGIEKSCEYRTWTQAVTFLTRADYLSPLFNEAAYCLSVERLLGITEQVPERATVIRVMVMELQRIASHLVWLATGGMELGATTAMIFGFREREKVLDLLELITGLRMNHAYIRPGGLAQDLPDGAERAIRAFLADMPKRIREYHALLTGQPVWKARMVDVNVLDAAGCIALGTTGPVL